MATNSHPVTIQLDQLISATAPVSARPVSSIDESKFKSSLSTILSTKYQYVLITNKFLKRAAGDGFFAFRIHQQGCQLLIKKALQQTEITYDFTTKTLTRNGHIVDASFFQELTKHIPNYISLVKQNKAQLIGKPMKELNNHG